jgi:demethylmenaquinone methyltransferase/2-methoxy-6-polyprenyl-1,4-benzoquinol methylase
MNRKDIRPYADRDGSKKEQVENMFDSIAKTYDPLNRFLSLGIDKHWRKEMLAVLDSERPKILLDVATGTADVACDAAERFTDCTVTGLDLSAEMLQRGQKKVTARNLEEQIKLMKGDSESLPFDDQSFDAVTVAFGVRNFENLMKGLKEMYRVLRPGGTLVVLEFSRPTRFPVKNIFNLYFKYVLPQIGRFTSKDSRAYTYLYESVQVFPQYETFEETLKSAGFSQTAYKKLTFGICSVYTAYKSS